MSDTLYVNKPGGIIAHLADGTSTSLLYGAKVPDDLADHVDPSTFADDKRRLGSEADYGQVRDSHERTALAEGGQVNSGSSPVPSNYNELDEDTKVRFIEQLARYPEAQAKVLIHETLFGGDSEKVYDAASTAAQISAKLQLTKDARPATAGFTDHTLSASVPGPGDPDVAPGDPAVTEAIQARALAIAEAAKDGDPKTPPPTSLNAPAVGPGDSLANLDKQQLVALADTEGVKLSAVEKNQPEKIIAKIEKQRSEASGS